MQVGVRGMPFRKLMSITALALSTLFIISLGLVCYLNVRTSVGEAITSTIDVQLATISDAINGEIETIRRICNSLAQSGMVENSISTISSFDNLASERWRAYNKLFRMLNLACRDSAYIDTIAIHTPQRNYYIGGWNHGFKHLPDLCFDAGEMSLGIAYLDIKEEAEGPVRQLCMAGSVASNHDYSICALISDSVFTDSIERYAGADEMVLLYRHDGQLISASRSPDNVIPDSILLPFVQSAETKRSWSDYMLCRMPIRGEDYVLVYTLPMNRYSQDYGLLLNSTLISLAVAVIVIVLCSNALSEIVLIPLRNLTEQMRQYSPDHMPENASQMKHRLTLRECMFLFIVFTSLTAIVTFVIVFNVNASKHMNRKRHEAFTAVVENVARSISDKLYMREDVMTRMIYDDELVERLRSDSSREALERLMEDNSYYGLYDDTLEFFDVNGIRLYSSNPLTTSIASVDSKSRGFHWIARQEAGKRLRFSLLSNIFEETIPIGRGQISFDVWNVNEIISAVSVPGVNIGLVDDKGEILVGNNVALRSDSIPWNIVNGLTVNVVSRDRYSYLLMQVGERPFYIALEYTPLSWMQYSLMALSENGYIFIIYIVLAFIISYVCAELLNRPMQRICTSLREVKPYGEYEIMLGSGIDEIQEINQAFYDMANRIDTLVEDLIDANGARLQLERDCKNAEIASLQMQINPHFLANTFETISCIIRDGKSEQACRMLSDLNNLFRYAISKQEYIITVREEIEYARAYIDIMKARYQQLYVEWELDEQAFDKQTIKLLLQPVLENAIRHGFGKPKPGNRIIVECRAQKDGICYCVSDNGKGISPEDLARLRRKLEDMRLDSYIGIMNVQSRVRLYCGEQYGVTIESAEGVGTKVFIRIPYLQINDSL